MEQVHQRQLITLVLVIINQSVCEQCSHGLTWQPMPSSLPPFDAAILS